MTLPSASRPGATTGQRTYQSRPRHIGVDSHDVRQRWAEQRGAYSPEYYAHHGPDERSEAVREHLDRTVGPTASVLELGCSSGRHLQHLYAHGYDDLAGIELNADSVDVMVEAYPELAATATIHVEAMEDALVTFDDGAFDAVFAVETLQHIHPEATWVFEEIARVTGSVLVVIENEGEDHPDREAGVTDVDGFPLYFRDWKAIFTDCGLSAIDERSGSRDTIRLFCTPDDRPRTDD